MAIKWRKPSATLCGLSMPSRVPHRQAVSHYRRLMPLLVQTQHFYHQGQSNPCRGLILN